MAINVATLTAQLDADHSKFSRGLRGASGDLDTFEKKSKGTFGRIGAGLATAAKVGGAAAVVAVGAIGVKAVTSFASFEKQMNDVFTLLPDISQDAMDAMSDQVLTLSRDFGVLPEETVPALYQALSAGVPPDNVFEFMEVATKAAIGGSVDLETAVDGVTSTVNAFADANLTATEASDIMFTTVRLGKTTMGELSKSLFQVSPVAAGLGIKFGDVGASLAALTAQGVPTSVAATQLRGAFVELGKEGTKAAKVFEKTAGVSFKQFIDEGGNVHEAFEVMNDAAKDMDVGVSDLFGSIEAGQAVLALTSEGGAAAFSNALHEMDESAGATEAAFKTMDQGLARSWDKIKATAIVALVKIGKKLAPFIQKAVDWFSEKLPGAIDTLMGWFEKLGPVIDNVVGFVAPVFQAIGKAVGGVIKWFRDLIGMFKLARKSGVPLEALLKKFPFGSLVIGIMKVVTAIKSFLVAAFDTVVDVVKFVIKNFDKLKPIIIGVAVAIGTILVAGFVTSTIAAGAAAIAWIAAAAPLLAIVAVIALVVAGFIWLFNNVDWFRKGVEKAMELAITAFNWLKEKVPPVFQFIVGVITEVMGVIITVITKVWQGIRAVWEEHGDRILKTVTTIFKAIWQFIEGAMKTVQGIINVVTGIISGDWQKAWDGVKKIIAGVWDQIQGIFDTALAVIQTVLVLAWDAILAVITGVWNAIATFISAQWETIKTAVGDAIESVRATIEEKSQQARDKVFEIFEAIRAFIWDKVIAVKNKVVEIFESIRSTIVEKVTAAKNTVGTVLEGIRQFFADKFTAAKDKVIEIMGAIKAEIGRRIDNIKFNIGRVLGLIPGVFRDKFQEAVNWVVAKFILMGVHIRGFIGKALTWATDIGKAIVRGILNGLSNLRSAVGNAISSALSSIPGAGVISNVVGGVSGFFGGGGSTSGRIDSNITNLFREHGGPLRAGQSAIVGEAGPELFTPSTRGFVSPAGSFGGGGNLTIVVEGSLFGAASVEDLIDIIETARRDRSLRGGALVG